MPQIEVRIRILSGTTVEREQTYVLERTTESVEVRLFNVQDGKLYGHYLEQQDSHVGEALRPTRPERLGIPSREGRIDMDKIAQSILDGGFAAVVVQTGGGTATLYASRSWDPLHPTSPAVRDDQGHFQIAAGPGWFEPRWLSPDAHAFASAEDFYVGVHDDGQAAVMACAGLDEHAIAQMIMERLRA